MGCEMNRRLLYKRNCRVGLHNVNNDQDGNNNDGVIPNCSEYNDEDELTIFHSSITDTIQTTEEISSLLKDLQSLLQTSDEIWNIPLALIYLDRCRSTDTLINNRNVPHLTYSTLSRLLVSSMIVSKKILENTHVLPKHVQDGVIKRFNISSYDELEEMENQFVQGLASPLSPTGNNFDNLFVPSDVILQVIHSWSVAFDNIPLFEKKINLRSSNSVDKKNNKTPMLEEHNIIHQKVTVTTSDEDIITITTKQHIQPRLQQHQQFESSSPNSNNNMGYELTNEESYADSNSSLFAHA